MIKIFDKKDSLIFAIYKGNPIFTHNEFRCKCHQYRCQHTVISTMLIDKFVLLRTTIGNKPIIISSGFRCSTHNIAEEGAKLSWHMLGFALDLICPRGISLEDFQKAAIQVGFAYTKIYPQWNGLHVDVRNQD